MEGKDNKGKFVEGHRGFKKPGTKNKKTLLAEERRAIFDSEVTQIFLDTIKKARPEYILDQYLGKATEKIDLGIKFSFDEPDDKLD